MSALIRPAAPDDLETSDALVVASINDLTTRFGFGPISEPRPSAFQRFSLNDDPERLWVAESGGEIVGFAFSWTCDDLWFLAQLFVEPGRQSSGLGSELLARTLAHAQARGARTKALITFAFNRASQGLYIRHGLYPICPLYMMSAPRETIAARVAASRLRADPVEPSQKTFGSLASFDRKALGVSRAKHHAYLLTEGGLAGLALWSGGECVGYAYVGPDGHIGPVAVAASELTADALAAAITFALQGSSARVSAFVSGASPAALDAAVRAGMRITLPMLLMGSGPLPAWDKYLPRNPGLM